jgi:tRNA dimethylallyltransferase
LEFISDLGFGFWRLPVNHPVFLVGPTASGKSAVTLELVTRLGGEIISVDSMQVYRGLDIGTAKPSAEERARVPHHLIDVVNLGESFDAAKFVELARHAENEIRSRHRLPIFCGGTGLYFKAYLEGLGEAPPTDEQLRRELEAAPLEELLTELAARDPETFARIDCKNPRRVIRAVEVIRLTGKPFSAQRAEWRTSRSSPGDDAHSEKDQSLRTSPATKVFGLLRSPEDLRRRIDVRVDDMFARGLVDETRALLSRGLEKNRTAMQAIGYRQVVEHLRGERSLAETIELVKIRTRQFAKRQMTWFRRQLSVEWLPVNSNSNAADVAVVVLRRRSERT